MASPLWSHFQEQVEGLRPSLALFFQSIRDEITQQTHPALSPQAPQGRGLAVGARPSLLARVGDFHYASVFQLDGLFHYNH